MYLLDIDIHISTVFNTEQSIPWRIYVYEGAFVGPPPRFVSSLSPSSLRLSRAYTVGVLLSLPTSVISKEEKKDAIDDDNEKKQYGE